MDLGNDERIPGKGQGIPANRRAMLAAQATLDPKLSAALEKVGVEFGNDELRDPYDQLRAVVENRDASPAAVPRLRLAEAAMRILQVDPSPREQRVEALRPVLMELIDPELRGVSEEQSAVDAVYEALSAAGIAHENPWSRVQDAGAALHSDLQRIENPSVGTTQFRLVEGGEYASRIEVRFEVQDPGNVGLDQIAPRVVPTNWPTFNSFFCDLSLIADRDSGNLDPGRLPVEPSAGARDWQRVFLEKVGSCPDGWFPDTFLLFTWSRSEAQLVLYYELAKRRPGDRTQLSIDHGFIQIDQLPGRYAVTALKTVLFDDKRVPSGGQLLAGFAFELGWFDQAINWFSLDAGNAAGDGAAVPLESSVQSAGAPAGMDAKVQALLNGCEADVGAVLSEVDGQWSAAVQQVRDGQYGLDAYVQDWAKVGDRTIRYGARSICRYVELAKALYPRKSTDS